MGNSGSVLSKYARGPGSDLTHPLQKEEEEEKEEEKRGEGEEKEEEEKLLKEKVRRKSTLERKLKKIFAFYSEINLKQSTWR